MPAHFEGVSDHGDKHDLVVSGLFTFLPRHVDSVDTVQSLCSQCVRALVGITARQKETFRKNHRSQPTHGTHATDLVLALALGHK
jgi:hypothetical protein